VERFDALPPPLRHIAFSHNLDLPICGEACIAEILPRQVRLQECCRTRVDHRSDWHHATRPPIPYSLAAHCQIDPHLQNGCCQGFRHRSSYSMRAPWILQHTHGGLLAITISDSLPADFTVTPSTIESTAPGQLVNVAEKEGDGWGFDRFPGRLQLPSTKRQKEGQLKDSNARNFIWIFSML
jgi:hypothetical protein